MDPRSQDFVNFQVPQTSDDAHPSKRSNRSSIVTPAEPAVELVVPLMVIVNDSPTVKGLSSARMYVWSRNSIVGIDESRVSFHVEPVLRCDLIVDLVRRNFFVIANLRFLEHGCRSITNLQTDI
jgi:hypothetical protein